MYTQGDLNFMIQRFSYKFKANFRKKYEMDFFFEQDNQDFISSVFSHTFCNIRF